MKVLISGTSRGIGLETAKRFLKEGYEVYGLDLNESAIKNSNYHHFICDIRDEKSLPEIEGINILFNNAGVQNSGKDIDVNLKGTINVTEKYGFQKSCKSILFNASASNQSGSEFPYYVASKAGVVGFMRHVALKLAKHQVTVNSISLGGVLDDLNKPVMNDKDLWNKIMEVTPMKKWTTLKEVADWVYFLTVVNKSMSGEDLLIDNGEFKLNSSFVWPK